MFKNKKETRSPIKSEEKPLRNPGESLEQELEDLIDEEILPYVFLVVVMILFIGYEWLRWFINPPPQPLVVTLVGALLIVYSVVRIFRFRSRALSLRQGIEGEKVVGQYLEKLRSQGCLIFHDIPGEGFNIDHVIVSTQGVFTVETKTLIKLGKGNSHIVFDGEKILVNGFELERNPVPQALAERSWLRNFLMNTTGISFPVKAVVVFPGWFVQRQNERKDEIWVLNHKALPKFIENEPLIIKSEDVYLIADRISDYIRREYEKSKSK